MLDITATGPNLGAVITDLEWKQLPYVMSRTLNQMGKIWGMRMAMNSAMQFKVKRSWSRRYVRGSLDEGINFKTSTAAFFSTQVKKNVPLHKMAIKVATASWQMMQQTDDHMTRRTPEYITLNSDNGNRVEYIALPIPKNLKNKQGVWSPNANHLLKHAKTERVFMLPSDNDPETKLLFQRYGNGIRDFKLLYILVKSVRITPKFDFTKVVEDVLNESFDFMFDRFYEDAMATAKV